MLPVTLGLLCALILHTAAGDCQGEKPTKQLFCYLDNLPAQFDPCLCTHLILQTPVDKLTPQSELLVSARRLQEKNPALRLVLQAAESAELALKRRGGYAQTVAAAVAKCDLDGVEVALAWGKQVAAKVQLVDFVQTLSKELDKIAPKDRTKRSYEIHENIEGDVVTPRWTPEANRRIHSRKSREAESSKETSTETAEKESLQEIEEEEELPENGKQIIVHLTSQPQHLAKNFDLKRLSKYVSFYTLASDNLTDSSESGLAYHPSRLMGIEDILNADSLVDLVTGLGAPHEKLVLTLPATALRFTLADRDHNMPQSKVQGTPVKITRAEMCKLMSEGEWTVERDEDLTAPYAYHDTTWLAFDDLTSVSIKGKYVLLRDLAGAAVRAADTEDWSRKCETSGPVLLKTLHDTFTHVARQSRAAQLVSLQEQLHSAGQFSYSGDVHLSPYRIVRVVDRAGSIHVVRKEAKTEFECSRQGYFRHPSGCNRFYRCVKFNQYTPDFTVFEYDCPAGLAFDETVEVCVWPGSLADGGACQGSSEIAPVPRSRYVCPQGAGYYADPENCRWFFACLDHQGDGSPLTAYEFRCPFGLVFDEQALVCNWPWLVPGCGGSGVYSARFTVGDFYEGRHRPSYASLSDVHVSGGRIENVPGGVVLGSSVAGLGSGAYLGSVASGSNVFGSEINTKSGYPGSANLLGGYVSGSGSGANAAGSAGAGYSAGSGSTYGSGGALGSGSVYNTGAGAYVTGSGSAGVGSGKYSSSYSGAGGAYSGGAGGAYSEGAGGAYSGGAHSGGASGAYSGGAGGAYSGGAGGAYSGGDGGVYSEGAGGAHSGGAGISSTRYGSYGNGAYASGGDYLSGNVGDYSGAYVEDNSGAYIHDNSGDYRGDLSGLYTGKESYGGQYKGGYVAGGAYVPGVYDNGAYSGSSSSGGQYKGSQVGGGAYSGSYDTGAYQGSGSTGGQYKGGYDTGSYSGKYDSGAYAGKYDAGAYAGKYDAGAYTGKHDAAAYAGNYDAGAYDGKYDAGAYAGKYDAGAYAGNYDAGTYAGKYDTGAYAGKYDAGAYAGKYDAGAYAGKYDTGAYAGKYDAGAYAGNYDSGAYVGKYDSGAYRGSSDTGAHGGSSSYQGGYKVQSVPAAVFTDGGYGSHEYNSVDVGHKPVAGLVGLGAVKLSGGAAHSGGYVSSYVTPSPLPAVSVTPVAPVVSSYSTVTPAPVPVSTYTVSTLQPSTPRPLTYYPVPSSPVTPVTSRPLISYSTVNPPAFVQSYQQPSYVKTVTPAPAVYSTPTVGFVKTSAVPLRPVSYGYKQNVVNTGYVSSGIQYSTPAPVSSIGFEQPSYVKTVTPAPYYEKAAVGYSYQKPIPPAYQAPLPSYNYEYQPPATFVKPVEVKYSFPQPAVLKTPIVPLNPIQYSTPAPVTYSVSPVKPVSYAVPVYPTASPLPPVKVSYAPTVFKTPVVPLNPVQYSTPAPIHFEYSTRAPVKTVSYSTYSTPAPPVVYQSPAPVRPLRPITYTTPAPPVSVQYSTPRPVQPVRPLRPVSYSTPAPFAVQYNVPTVLKTPVVPLNPVQYSTPTPINFAYSTPTPPRPVNFVQPFTYSTPAPAVSYEYSPPAPVQPVSYVKPLKQVTYTYPTPAPAVTYEYSAPVVKPVIPLVNKTPVVPLNPIQYTTPAPPRFEVGYSTPVHPVAPAVTYQYSTPAPRPVRPVAYPTPAPAVSYEYSAPIQPVSYAKPLKPVTYSTYSTAAPAVHYPAPVVTPAVLKTPVIPLNPIQYTTSAPVHFEYSTPAPVPVRHLRPITYTTPAPAVNYEYLPPAPVQPVRPLRPITYTTPAPAVSYEYIPPAPVRPLKPLRPITYTTPAPAVTYEFSAPVVPTVLKTPVVPLNPIQYTTPAPVHFEYSTPAPVPVRPLRPITYTTPAPAISYEYSPPAPVRPVRPLRPISYTTPATAINLEYTSPVVKHVVPTVVKTPVVPLNPIQYTTPAPVHFEYSTPAPVRHVTYTTAAPAASYVPVQQVQPLRPITLSSPSPFSYDFKYQPVKQVPAVLKTPVVPLNPIQYTTPAPAIFQYSTPAPIQTVRYNKPVRPVTYTPSAPTVSYEYSTASPPETYGYKTSSYVKPVPTVLKTPVVPLNPVQYSTSSPIINQYRFGVAYQNPEIQYQPDVYYKQPAHVKTQVVQEGYDYPRPSVKFVEGPRIVSTTPAPTVTYTQEPVTPIYKQVYNYVKAPMVSAYEKVLNAISYSTTPAPLPVQPVTKSPVSYAPVTVGPSYNRPALVKTPSIPLTPVAVVPEYQKVLNVVKATTTSSPLYVNHYTNTYEQELVPVSTPRPVVYKQKPVVLTETTYTDTYDENVEDVYDSIKSDFGTRLTGGYEGGYVYNQQKVEVPQINVYTSTSAPAPVIKETYKVRRPITTYTQTYQQPAVAVGYEEGSYEEGSFYSSTPAPAIVSSSESGFGEQYHKETSFAGYTGQEGDVVSYEEVAQPLPVVTSTTQAPTVKITTARVSLPVVTPRPEGGYYVRKQKVRVRPVVTTENYPDVYSSTYPSTVSTTTFAPIYSTTPASPVTFSTTGHPEDEVDVEGEEEEEDGVKLLEGYDGQYGGVVSKGGYSVSSTVASIEDGEAIVGVLKKGRVTFDGRRTKTRVVVVSKLSDFNPLLVGKLGAECSCDGRSNSVAIRRSKQRGSGRLFTPSRDSTIPDQQYVDTYLTSTSTAAPIVVNSESSSYESSAYESSSYDSPVVEIRPLRKKTRFYSTTTSAPEYASTISEEPNFLPGGNDRVKVDSVQCKRAGLFRHPNKCNKFYSCNWDQWKKKFTLHEFKCPIHLAYDINLGACNWPSKGPACSDDNLLV